MPCWHFRNAPFRIGWCKGEMADVLCTRHLEETRRGVAIEDKVRVSEIMNDDHVVFTAKSHDLLEEGQVHHRRRRVVRVGDNEHLGSRPGLLGSREQVLEEIPARS